MKATTNRVGAVNYVIYIILFLALLALNGALNFVVANFDPAVFRDATFWVKTTTGALSGLGAFIIFAFMRRDTLTIKDSVYLSKETELNKTIAGHVDQTIQPFVAHKNHDSKRTTWIERKSRQLQRHIEKVPQRLLDDMYVVEKLGEELPPRRAKRLEKWTKKRDFLQLQLTNEWIEENLTFRRLIFPRITVSEIVSGADKAGSKKRVINDNAMGQLLRDRLPIIIINTGLQSIYHAVAITQAQDTMEIIIGIIFQLITIFTNVAIGLNYGRTLFEKIDLANIDIRRFYIAEYLVWKKTYAAPTPNRGDGREGGKSLGEGNEVTPPNDIITTK